MNNVAAIMVALATLLVTTSAFACTCAETKDRDESYRTAKYVFFGEAKKSDDGEIVLRVLENFRGTRKKREHPVGKGDCAFDAFEVGKRYMVFATKGESKREVVADKCGATAQVDHEPLSALIWTLADELAYGASRRTMNDHQKHRGALTSNAESKLKAAGRECDPDLFKGKGEAKGELDVTFEVQPDGEYVAKITKYETTSEDPDKARACLTEQLVGKKFKRFPGGPVGVSAYWVVDRLDASFGREKRTANVVAYRSTNP